MQSLTLYRKRMTTAEFLAQEDFDGWFSTCDEPGMVNVIFWAPAEPEVTPNRKTRRKLVPKTLDKQEKA